MLKAGAGAAGGAGRQETEFKTWIDSRALGGSIHLVAVLGSELILMVRPFAEGTVGVAMLSGITEVKDLQSFGS